MGEGWPSKAKYRSMNITYFSLIAVFAAVLVIVILYSPSGPTLSDLNRLSRGMSPSDVKAVLGEPPLTLPSLSLAGSPEDTWTYYLPRSHWSVSRETWQLKFYEGRLDSWYKMR